MSLSPPLDLAAGTVDLVRATLRRSDGSEVSLTERECALLDRLARTPGQDVSRETLLVEVWGHRADSSSRAVDHTMRRLRAKVELEAHRPRHLLTVHGVGYRYVPLARPVPPPRSVASDLVGRTPELAALRAATHWCVQVVGPGGVGKTRLVREWMPHTARFVDLSAATTRGQVVAAVARALGVGRRHLPAVLADTAPCLVLDNAEQVAAPLTAWLAPWADVAAGPRFVVTSRVALDLPSARVVVRGLASAEAVTLYRRRLGSLRLPPDAPVAQLVARLDGLPLAIELAAARAPLQGPDALLARLAPRATRPLAALGRRAGGPVRHRALDAALDWSWDLLDDHEQGVLASLAAFSGGFSAAAVDAVVGPVGVATVERLARASLVELSTDGTARGRLSQCVRDFVRERSPARADAGERAHLEHFRVWCAARPPPAQVAAELDNLLAAARVAIRHREPLLALVETLEPVLAAHGPPGTWAELAQAVSHLGARGARVVARYHLGRGDAPAAAATLAAVAGVAREDAAHHLLVARVRRARRDFVAAETALDDGAACAPAGSVVAAQLLHQRGVCAIDQGRWPHARTHLQAAVRAWARLGRPADEARAALHLGHVALEVGDLDTAVARYAQARAGTAGTDPRGWALATVHFAFALVELGDLPAAEGAYTEARAVFTRLGDRRFGAFCDLVAADHQLAAGDPHTARRSAGRAAVRLEDLGDQTFAAAACARVLVACGALGDGPGADRAAQRLRGGLPEPHRADLHRLVDALVCVAQGRIPAARALRPRGLPPGHLGRRLASHLDALLVPAQREEASSQPSQVPE